ncbi:MAG: DUF4131 domain-containing protein [Chitinivibrionales bacterium]|nr:DUF4131 domain-containing protein [Chitinivibrionales bacterium]
MHFTKYRLKHYMPGLNLMLRLPAFTGWLFLCAGIISGHFVLSGLSTIVYPRIGFMSTALLLIAALISSKLIFRNILIYIAGILLITSTVSSERIAYSNISPLLHLNEPCYVSGTVTSPVLPCYGKYRFVIKADSIHHPFIGSVLHNKNLICVTDQPLIQGSKITCKGEFILPYPPKNPGAFDEYSYMHSRHLWGKFYADSVLTITHGPSSVAALSNLLRNKVLSTLSHIKDLDNRAILQAAFLGERHLLTNEIKTLFRDAGVYHLLAISGLHLTIITGFIYALLFLLPLGKGVKIVIVLLLIWSYLLFIGFIPSLFRAVIMITLFSSSFLFQRHNYSINTLGMAGILWLLFSPKSLFMPGYQLSFAATFAIIALTPLLKEGFEPLMQTTAGKLMHRAIILPLEIVIAGFIGTAPILAYHFETVSLFGFFANIFSPFLMSFCMCFFLAGLMAQSLLPPLASILTYIAEVFLNLLVSSAQLSQKTPLSSLTLSVIHPEIIIIYGIVVAGVIGITRKFRTTWLLYTSAVFLFAFPLIFWLKSRDNTVEITLFNCPENAVAGIRWPGRKLWIIGLGNEHPMSSTYRKIIKPWLRQHPLCRIDAVIATGLQPNPIHSLDPLLKQHKPGSIYTLNSQQNRNPSSTIKEFADEFGIPTLPISPDTRFVPVRPCTCTVSYVQASNKRMNAPPIFHISAYGHHLTLGPDNKDYLLIEPSESIPLKNKKEGTNSIRTNTGKGAWVLKIKPNGIREIKRVVSSHHPLHDLL